MCFVSKANPTIFESLLMFNMSYLFSGLIPYCFSHEDLGSVPQKQCIGPKMKTKETKIQPTKKGGKNVGNELNKGIGPRRRPLFPALRSTRTCGEECGL
jgi:hypothetical protein